MALISHSSVYPRDTPPNFALPDDEDQARKEKAFYFRQRAQKEEPAEADDVGEHDWTITYVDMVTLMMAFFVFLAAMSFVKPTAQPPIGTAQQEEQKQEKKPVTSQARDTTSPFEGRGWTAGDIGTPSNRDNVVSEDDDPEATNGTTDPTMADPVMTAAPQPAPTLAQDLQNLIKQDNLAGQVEIIRSEKSVTLRISDRILFSSGQSILQNEGQALVARLSALLNQSGGMISIEGHTDDRPIRTSQFTSNWELSAARATEVLRQLTALGLPANRLRAIAYADTRPVAPNTSAEGRMTNRRVELVVTDRP